MTELVPVACAPGTAQRRRAWNGVFVLTLLVIGAGAIAVLSGVGRVERGLTDDVTAQLVTAGATGHQIEVKGRQVTLIGPDAESYREVVAGVDGVSSVKTRQTPDVPATATSAAFAMLVTEDLAVLRGVLPDEASRAAAIRAARSAFPTVETNLEIGSDTEPSWTVGLWEALPELSRIRNAELTVEGDLLTLNGSVIDVGTRREIGEAFEAAVPRLEREIVLTLDNGEPAQSDNADEVAKNFASLLASIPPGTALFSTGDAALTAAGEELFAEVARILLANPGTAIEIGGHTDASGSVDGNQRLSEARAAAGEAFLVEAGVNAALIDSRGFGDTMPIAPNDTAEGRAKNRRVTITVAA